MIIRKVAVIILALFLISGCSDDDTPTNPGNGTNATITISNGTAEEGETVTFNITLSEVSTNDVSYSYSSQTGTANSSDYTTTSGSKIITAGSTTSSVTVTTIEDTNIEADETFTMILSNASVGFTNNDSLGLGTITNDDGAPSGVSFAADIQPIIDGRCAISGCHDSGASSGGLSLGSGSYSSVRNGSGSKGAIISVSNAAASNLYLKTTSSPPFGARMPFGQNPLSVSEQEKIRDWINQGALNN